MIITCPHCRTRYQVAVDAIGSAGRKVECAACHQGWFASSEEDDAFAEPVFVDPVLEDSLDEAMEAEAAAVAPYQPPPQAPATEPARMSEAEMRRRQREFLRRRRRIGRLQPGARLRRLVRVAVYGVLAMLLVTAVLGREAIVRVAPDLAGLYAGAGLAVNVVGLEFSRLDSMLSRRDGRPLLIVRGEVRGLASRAAPFPPILVSLVDEDGHVLYRWSVTPPAASLAGGELAAFETQMVNPPPRAARVRVGFGGGS